MSLDKDDELSLTQCPLDGQYHGPKMTVRLFFQPESLQVFEKEQFEKTLSESGSRTVLRWEDFNELRDRADEYLHEPFRPGAPE
jgi:hypothetical protein